MALLYPASWGRPEAAPPYGSLRQYIGGRYLVYRPGAEDARVFAQDARKADMREWRDGSGFKDFRFAVTRAVCQCQHVFAVYRGATEGAAPLAIWGAEPNSEDSPVGTAWLALTNSAMQNWRDLQRIFPEEMSVLHSRFPILYAFADKRNTVHTRWMERVGFRKGAEVLLGPKNLPFIHYIREDSLV